MSNIIHLSSSESQTIQHHLEEFKVDLATGFSKTPKEIESKYFYDKKGSHLFNCITKHPDYYLTQVELDILDSAKQNIADILGEHPINLVELGPGEGIKTALLIDHFTTKNIPLTYIPIDISSPYLEEISQKIEKNHASLSVLAIHADYHKGLEWINLDSNTCNLVLFLGSSIGNFSPIVAQDFFNHMRQNLHKNDYALIGFDLHKATDILIRAYNDSDGITRDFNLNLLHRINRELEGDFEITNFEHHPEYNTEIGAMESHLISLKNQTVTIRSMNQTFSFEQNEKIHVECSYKYSLNQIEAFASAAQFKIVKNYTDSDGYYVNSLWQAI